MVLEIATGAQHGESLVAQKTSLANPHVARPPPFALRWQQDFLHTTPERPLKPCRDAGPRGEAARMLQAVGTAVNIERG